MKAAGFVDLIEGHAATMPKNAPPILVAHPHFGAIGHCHPKKGLVHLKGEWLSFQAIKRESDALTVKRLRMIEDKAPKMVAAFLLGLIAKNPMMTPMVVGAISSYDGIIAARGGGLYQDIWMYMTANQTPVTTSWYDMMNFASFSPASAPSITAYVNSATGGAVMTAASNGSFIPNPAGSNKKYIIGVGLSVTAINGFTLAMLYDCLWAGEYSLTSNTTINPTTDVTVTRWSSTTPGNAAYAGGNMQQMRLSATLTHTGTPTITVSYTDQGGGAASLITIAPATGPLINRIIGNTTHNSATVMGHTPFMPYSNGDESGATGLTQVVVSGGNVSSGSVSHKIIRPLIMMPFIAASSYIEQDATLNIGNMVELQNASQVCGCLGWNLYSNGTTAAAMSAFLRTVEG